MACPSGSVATRMAAASAQDGCERCPNGMTSSGGATTQCSAASCEAGHGWAEGGEGACAPCPAGTYSDGKHGTTCLPMACAVGYAAYGNGATTATETCAPCGVGGFSPGGAVASCAPTAPASANAVAAEERRWAASVAEFKRYLKDNASQLAEGTLGVEEHLAHLEEHRAKKAEHDKEILRLKGGGAKQARANAAKDKYEAAAKGLDAVGEDFKTKRANVTEEAKRKKEEIERKRKREQEDLQREVKRTREQLEREEIAAEDAALARVAGGPSGLSPQTAVKRQRDDDDSDDEEEEPVDLHGDNRVD